MRRARGAATRKGVHKVRSQHLGRCTGSFQNDKLWGVPLSQKQANACSATAVNTLHLSCRGKSPRHPLLHLHRMTFLLLPCRRST